MGMGLTYYVLMKATYHPEEVCFRITCQAIPPFVIFCIGCLN